LPVSSHSRLCALFAAAGSALSATPALAVFDRRFDVATFYETTEFSADHFVQAHFDNLNWSSPNGHLMMMGTDQRRTQLNGAGNVLGAYYNTLTNLYTSSGHDPIAAADTIRQYVLDNFTSTGVATKWISLNEISGSLWPSNGDYRAWLRGTISRLKNTYSQEVILFSPFPNPVNNAADWGPLSQDCYIAVEQYLSGEEIKNNGYSVTWAQNQYLSSKNSYIARGVDPSKIIMTEHFGQTTAGTGWGRAGLPIAEWQQAIAVRSDAIRNVGFAGFISYAWSKNGMMVSDAEMIAAEQAYRSRIVVETEGPRWKNDAAGSWSTAANWESPFVSVPPNGMSEVANFVTALTSPRTIMLDAPRTLGRMTFDSAIGYTIAAGAGGSLTLANNALPTSITVPTGSHTISAGITFNDSVDMIITGGLTLSGPINIPASKAINKTGNGTLVLSGTQSPGSGAIVNADAGLVTFKSSGGQNLTVNVKANASFDSSQRISALNVTATGVAQLTRGGAKVLNTATVTPTGKLDLTDNDMIVRSSSVGTWTAGKYNGISGYVASGANGGTWNGFGIITSEADALNSITTLGVASASEALAISGAKTALWNGQSVNPGDVLVMYTFSGDGNLDGTVNADDYAIIDFYSTIADANGYLHGDYNYDGAINADDYALIDSNSIRQGASLAPSLGLTAVPEPAGVACVLFTALALRRRRCAASVGPSAYNRPSD
jgi:hypothetical protein